MKKQLILIVSTFLLIVLILVLLLIGAKSKNKELSDVNAEYEFYTGKEIYGTELVTLINKAIDNNKRLEVKQDQNGFYLDNGKDSILIKINISGTNKSIEMEKVYALGTDQFIDLYNSEIFVSDKVTYHKETGRIASISFKQIEK